MFVLPYHLIVCLMSLIGITGARIHDRCDFARTLRYKHKLSLSEINVWACIAQYQSGFNSEAIGNDSDGTGYYGMFQISDRYWCSPSKEEVKACDILCSQLLDDDLTDDFKCIRNIFDEHQRISGNGYNAWTSYKNICQYVYEGLFTNDCFVGDVDYIPTTTRTPKVVPKQALTQVQNRIYDRCELSRELWYVHHLPADQIATWVCIAKHESSYNTSAVGHGDHGLFQISDIYWCSPPGRGWVCGLSCAKLEDSDISDDVECMKKIYNEHERLSGDGFNAWSVYRPYCKGRSEKYIEGCFDYSDLNSVVPYSYGVELESGATASDEVKSIPQKSKIFERCELAIELHQQHKIPIELVPTYVCIAYHESKYNTSAVGRLNTDGSGDHGIFQISDIYWCSPPGMGRACGLSCAKLEDSDITDDVKCMKKIYDEHEQLSGDGFNAWSVYIPYCKGQSDHFIDGCFNEVSNSLAVLNHRPAVTAPSFLHNNPQYSSKVYNSHSGKVRTNVNHFETTTKPIEKQSTITTSSTSIKSIQSSFTTTPSSTSIKLIQSSTTTVAPKRHLNIVTKDLIPKIYATTPTTVRYTPTVSNRFLPRSSITTEATYSSTSTVISERERVKNLFDIYFNGFRTRPPTTLKSIFSATRRPVSNIVWNTGIGSSSPKSSGDISCSKNAVESIKCNPVEPTVAINKKSASSSTASAIKSPFKAVESKNYTTKPSSTKLDAYRKASFNSYNSSTYTTTIRPFIQKSTTATVQSKITYQSIFGQRPSSTTIQSLPAYYSNRLTTTTTKSPSINQISNIHDNSVSMFNNNRFTRAQSSSSSTLSNNLKLTSSEHIHRTATTTTTTQSSFDRIFDLFVH